MQEVQVPASFLGKVAFEMSRQAVERARQTRRQVSTVVDAAITDDVQQEAVHQLADQSSGVWNVFSQTVQTLEGLRAQFAPEMPAVMSEGESVQAYDEYFNHQRHEEEQHQG